MTTEHEPQSVETTASAAPFEAPSASVAAVAPVVPVAAPRRRWSRLLDLALAAAAILAIGGVAFAAGRLTAPAASSAFARGGLEPGGVVVRPDGSSEPGSGPGRGAFALDGGLSVAGTVTAVDADSLTLRLADGREMTFALDDSTAYHESTDATSSDVTVGADVSVTVDADGGTPSGAGSSGMPRLPASDVTVKP